MLWVLWNPIQQVSFLTSSEADTYNKKKPFKYWYETRVTASMKQSRLLREQEHVSYNQEVEADEDGVVLGNNVAFDLSGFDGTLGDSTLVGGCLAMQAVSGSHQHVNSVPAWAYISTRPKDMQGVPRMILGCLRLKASALRMLRKRTGRLSRPGPPRCPRSWAVWKPSRKRLALPM